MEYHYHIPIISLSFPYHFHIISLEEPYEPWITWARHIHLWILHPAAPPAPSWQTLGLVCGQPGQETSDINWIIYMYVLLSWCIHKHNYMTYIYIYTWFHQHVYRYVAKQQAIHLKKRFNIIPQITYRTQIIQTQPHQSGWAMLNVKILLNCWMILEWFFQPHHRTIMIPS